MPKLMMAVALTATALGLAACNYNEQEYNEANADYNAEEMNYADNMTDYNMADMNDMNAMDNATSNAMDKATGNEAIDANTSY